eukprot:jgi/Mesvir1/1176/Mv17673-RA.1
MEFGRATGGAGKNRHVKSYFCGCYLVLMLEAMRAAMMAMGRNDGPHGILEEARLDTEDCGVREGGDAGSVCGVKLDHERRWLLCMIGWAVAEDGRDVSPPPSPELGKE